MKKNKLMRLASALLVLTLLSTTLISGTFAKYTTSVTVGGEGDSANGNSARVAAFGVQIKANTKDDATGITLFQNTYATDDEEASNITNSVSATSSVVAPGTKYVGTDSSTNGFTLSITGTPEVAVKVVAEATINLGSTEDDSTDWKVDTNDDGEADTFYCPLIFTITDNNANTDNNAETTKTIDGTCYSSLSALVAALQDALKCTKSYDPGTDLASQSGMGALNATIEWEWPFERTEVATDAEVKPSAATANKDDIKAFYDGLDTQLGNSVTADEEDAITGFPVEITIKATVTQID